MTSGDSGCTVPRSSPLPTRAQPNSSPPSSSGAQLAGSLSDSSDADSYSTATSTGATDLLDHDNDNNFPDHDPPIVARRWPPSVGRVFDSLSTTVSDSVLTPVSPSEPLSFGFGAYVDSPVVASLSTRFIPSPITMDPPAWPGRTPLQIPSSKQPPSAASSSSPNPLTPTPLTASSGSSAPSQSTAAPSPRQRPSPLELTRGHDHNVLDLTDPPLNTGMSTCSMHSTISNELLDLSNLRRSMQQNLRDRPIGSSGTSDCDLESIKSESVPSSPYDDGRNITPSNALALFGSSPQYLVIDTRILEDFGAAHIHRSANVSIPTLLLNRLRKQTTRAGVAGWVSLTRYVSTTTGQALWDSIDLSKSLDLIILGADSDDVDAPYTLADILEPLVTKGMVRVLDGGWSAIADKAHAAGLVAKDAPHQPNPDLVVVTTASPDGTTPNSRTTFHPESLVVSPATAAPAPSQTNVPAISPSIAVNNHLSARALPNLSITTPTASAPRRPPKLQLHTTQHSAPKLVVGSGGLTAPLAGPQHTGRPKLGGLTIDVGPSRVPEGPRSAIPTSTQSLSSAPRLGGGLGGGLSVNTMMQQGAKTSTLAPPGEPWGGGASTPMALTTNFSNLPPPTPSMPTHSSSPIPPPQKQPAIDISTILPSFLYLGPEIATKSDVDDLLALGVRRILNCAVECDDDEGLGLRTVFDKYYRIPMKDSVDESGVSKGIRDACQILDDARLHSAPVYVHCKAGRSRSVTVVLAYLIHANAWTLHTSYQYVAERRHGISPNIGFVAELMEFETAELGTKQPGRGRDEDDDNTAGEDEEPPLIHREPRVGPRYTRESLPPEFGSERLLAQADGDDHSPVEEGHHIGEHAPENHRSRRKPQPDIEVRKNGQWVLRKTPVDRVTLQPGRRVSKAGLESMIMRPLRRPDEA